ISLTDLRELARSGLLQSTDLVSQEGTDDWVPAASVEGLFPNEWRRWYYTYRGRKLGPVTGDCLRELAARGMLEPTDLVWRDGLDRWRKAKRLVGLFPKSRPAWEHSAILSAGSRQDPYCVDAERSANPPPLPAPVPETHDGPAQEISNSTTTEAGA